MKKVMRKAVGLVPFTWRRHIRRIPMVAAAQRWFVSSALSGDEFEHEITGGPASGLKMAIRLPDDKAMWQGTYELALTQRLRDLVDKDSVCFDIGGYRGYVSGVMALAGARKVYVFEPNPTNIQSIRRMMSMNAGLPISLVEVAVSDADGAATFQVMDDGSMGKLAESSFQAGRPALREVKVTCRSLDSLLAEGAMPVPAVMKIDVEGAELHVLRGARQLLRKHRPKLAVEVHSVALEAECAAFLQAEGYETESWSVGHLEMPRHLFAVAK